MSVSERVSVVVATVLVITSVNVESVVVGFGVTVTVGVMVECTVTVRVVLVLDVVLGTDETEVTPYLVLQTSIVDVWPWATRKDTTKARHRHNDPRDNIISWNRQWTLVMYLV